MREDLIRRFRKSIRRNGLIYRQFVMFLAAVVVFTTTYALILPALTIDADTADAKPGIEISEEADSQEAGPETVIAIGDEDGRAEPVEETKKQKEETALSESVQAREDSDKKAAEDQKTDDEEAVAAIPSDAQTEIEASAEDPAPAEDPEAVSETAGSSKADKTDKDRSAYKTSYQLSDGRTKTTGDCAGNDEIIVNSPEDAYELPSTGGPGTSLIYILGILLLAGAGSGLLMRRQTSCQ